MERQFLENRETKQIVKDIEREGPTEINKHYYYCLQEEDYLKLYNGETISENVIYEEIDQNYNNPMVRDVILHSPQNESNLFEISLNTLYIKKRDIVFIEKELGKTITQKNNKKELSPTREHTLHKVIGALIEVNYKKEGKYRTGDRWNASQLCEVIENQILDAGYNCEGILDTTMRKLIPKAMDAIKENKKKKKKIMK